MQLASTLQHPTSYLYIAIAIEDDLLLAKISLETPENLFDNVFRRSSICAESSARASSDVYSRV